MFLSGSFAGTKKVKDQNYLKKELYELIKSDEGVFDFILDSSLDGLWYWDLEKPEEEWMNGKFWEVLGYNPDEMPHKSSAWQNIIFPDDLKVANENFIQHCKNPDHPYDPVVRYKHKDGSTVWIRCRGLAIRDESGNPIRMLGAHHDISKIKRQEEELRQSKEQLEIFFSQSMHGFFVCMLDEPIPWQGSDAEKDEVVEYVLDHMRITKANQAILDQYGAMEENFIGISVRKLFQHDVDHARQLCRGILEHGQYRQETREQRLDGTPIIIEGEYSCLYDDQGRIMGNFGVQVDVTERKHNQAEIEKLSLVAKHTANAIIITDRDRCITWVNESFSRMTGYTAEEALGRNPSFLQGPETHPETVVYMREKLNAQQPFTVEVQNYTKDGKLHWIRLEVMPLLGSNGLVQQFFSVQTDITEEKRREEELQKTKEQAEAANLAKSQFLANMSHEIRTPLNGVIGFTDLLRDTPLSTVQHHYVENANISGHTLLGIINDILDFSKIEAGMLELEVIKTDMVELFENSADIDKLAAANKNLEILLNLDPDMPRFAKVDPTRLKQILTNLVSNAIKFTKEGEVELKVRYQAIDEAQGKFSISVRDTGIGISESQKAKLFRAFSQADSSTNRKFGGTGLGLIISDMIAGKMGSKIEIDSVLGEGSTFRFDLTVETEQGEKRSPGDLSSVQRCLVIEDNANNRMILQRLLTGWGIESECCDNGLEALKLLNATREFDAIICDYNIPHIDGLEIIRMIRQKLRLTPEKQPILLLHSSADDLTLIEQCAELGVRFCITKPVKQEKLFECLSLLHRAPDRHIAARSTRNEGAPESPAATQAEQPTLKVLVAEDVHLNMLLIKSLLPRVLPHAQVIEAENGRIALEAYKQETPDLILMDVHMPEMDGLETTMAIRELEKETGTHVPIVALTAGAIKEDEELCLQAGMDGFLTKPIESQKLSELFQNMKIGKD